MKMKKFASVVPALIAAAAFLLPAAVGAATTANGTLTVTATVVPSMTLVFDSDAAGVVLTGTGTNAATLPFGSINAFGTYTGATGSTRVVGGSSFTVSSPFGLDVEMANTAAEPTPTYTLKVTLAAADATNTWSVGPTGSLVNVSTGTQQTITSTGANGVTQYTLSLQVPFSEKNAGTNIAISNSLSFAATAN
jgi:hypothetical protein